MHGDVELVGRLQRLLVVQRRHVPLDLAYGDLHEVVLFLLHRLHRAVLAGVGAVTARVVAWRGQRLPSVPRIGLCVAQRQDQGHRTAS